MAGGAESVPLEERCWVNRWGWQLFCMSAINIPVWPPLLGFPGIAGVEIKVQTQGTSGSSRGRPGHCSDLSPPGGGVGTEV